VAFNLKRKAPASEEHDRWIEPRLGPDPGSAKSAVFDAGRKTIVDCAHVRVERLGTHPVLFSKVFKEFEDRTGHKYDYRYWAERENFFLREFLKRQNEFTHVVQARHLISENEAAKQVLTRDAGITIADWLRVKPRYADTDTLSHPFQRSDAFLRMLRACLVALKQIHEHRIVHCDIKEDNICIPYAPNPFPGGGRPIRLEYENLKLIDFAFAIAHSIPLTQILVINPDERVPYQSDLLVSALRADRRSGCPNAVQQLDYRVITDGTAINQKILEDLDISTSDYGPTTNPGEFRVFLTKATAEKLAKLKNVRSVEPFIWPSDVMSEALFPGDSNHFPWNLDNYGPIWIPKKGVTVPLSKNNLALYQRLITLYEGHTLDLDKDGTIRIDDKVATEYTFKMNYYWMMGDNRHNSLDSRYWGFVPEDHIVGKAWFIWMSWNKSGSFIDKIRWERLFHGIH